MDKRVIAVFTAFCFSIGALCLRLYTLSSKGTTYVVSESHYFTIDIQNIRGEILDCNGKKIVDNNYENSLILKPTPKSLSLLEEIPQNDNLQGIKERLKKGNVVMIDIGTSYFEESDDVFAVHKSVRYSKKQLARHIIGYINSDNRGVCGIEKSFDELLYTGKTQQVRFTADAYGRIISGVKTEKLNFGIPTGYVQLTLDSRIQQAAETAFDSFNISEGGAVVLDVQTGAIRAMLSRPDFDTDNLAEYLDMESAPLVNRALNAYAVGSVFKAVVAASALEHGINDFYYTCTGMCNVDGTVFGCNNHKVHGELNMQKALECSCNTYFINLAQKLGGETLLETAGKLGLGEEIELADGLISKSGQLPTTESLKKTGALANFSFGQGDFTATLLQMAQVFTAIANKGQYITPYLVEKTVTEDTIENDHRKQYPVIALSESTSKRLTEMLTSVVENGNAKKAKLSNGISAAGKTATAQTGAYGKMGVEIYNTWFCGFFPSNNPKYVIVVLKQGGSSGAEDCAPVFKAIADRINGININDD